MPDFTFRHNDQFLKRLAAHFREGPERVHRELARRAEQTIHEALDQQFQTGTDPYGRPYIPAKDGHLPPMVRSGKLWEGLGVVVSASATGVSVRVTATEEYAKFLQYGTRKMRARLIVPGENVLASIWRQHLERARDEAMKAWLSGRL